MSLNLKKFLIDRTLSEHALFMYLFTYLLTLSHSKLCLFLLLPLSFFSSFSPLHPCPQSATPTRELKCCLFLASKRQKISPHPLFLVCYSYLIWVRGFWSVLSSMYGRQYGNQGTPHHIVPQVPRSLDKLPSSFYISESPHACLLCYVWQFLVVKRA